MTDDKRLSHFSQHTYGAWSYQKDCKTPLVIDRADGVYIYDKSGKPYIDMASQLMCCNLGHNNRTIIEAIKKQAEKLSYIAPSFAAEVQMDVADALSSILPEGLDKCFFSTSGTEANEAALKMVRMSRKPAYKFISRYRSYHGETAGSITITGDPRHWYAQDARFGIEGVVYAPDCYCYRCPFGLTYGGCNIQCARYVEYMIQEENFVAAVIVEPVVGTNGRLVPPPEYFPILREICDRHNVLLIADEVMSGWYRTGKLFAIDNWNTMPDIITTAKGCTGAYTPAGITITSRKFAEFFETNLLEHGHTYAKHPLVMAAIPAAIGEYKKLIAKGDMPKVAAHLRNRLYELGEKHISVGDVRGIGHFYAMELVKNRKTKEPFNVKADRFTKPLTAAKVAAEAMKNGLYVVYWYDALMIAPPLIMTEAEVDAAVEKLDKALDVADREAEDTGAPMSRSSEFVK